MESVEHGTPFLDLDTWNSLPEAAWGWDVSLDTGNGQCTLCGGCTHVCPTKAFTLQWDYDRARLSFDAAQCVGCGACISSCGSADDG